MTQSPSSIAAGEPAPYSIREPASHTVKQLFSSCSVIVQILFSLCPVSVQYLTSESQPPAMRLYKLDSFDRFFFQFPPHACGEPAPAPRLCPSRAPVAISLHDRGIPLHFCGKGVAKSSDGPGPSGYESHNYATVSNTSTGRRRSGERTLASLVTPLTRSDTAEVGTGAVFHSVPFPSIYVL